MKFAFIFYHLFFILSNTNHYNIKLTVSANSCVRFYLQKCLNNDIIISLKKQGGIFYMNILEQLKQRGLVKQVVFEEELKQELDNGMVSFYCGFDPTADSLTIGHFLPILMAKRLQLAGHKPYIIVGGATAKIGDPTGRTDMRKMLTEEQLAHNVSCIRKQLERYISFEGENGAVLLDNSEWLDKVNYIDFIREIGACLSVNRMLTAECFKQRLEKGLSFLEFNYMPMQAYDFYYLCKNHNVIHIFF